MKDLQSVKCTDTKKKPFYWHMEDDSDRICFVLFYHNKVTNKMKTLIMIPTAVTEFFKNCPYEYNGRVFCYFFKALLTLIDCLYLSSGPCLLLLCFCESRVKSIHSETRSIPARELHDARLGVGMNTVLGKSVWQMTQERPGLKFWLPLAMLTWKSYVISVPQFAHL